MSTHNSTIVSLQRAIAIAEQIQKLEAELVSILGGSVRPSASKSAPATSKPGKKKKRILSPEARARIAAAQKARWAKVKGESPAQEKKTAAKPKAKRKISAEARAKMAAAAKRRWEKVKKA